MSSEFRDNFSCCARRDSIEQQKNLSLRSNRFLEIEDWYRRNTQSLSSQGINSSIKLTNELTAVNTCCLFHNLTSLSSTQPHCLPSAIFFTHHAALLYSPCCPTLFTMLPYSTHHHHRSPETFTCSVSVTDDVRPGVGQVVTVG